MLREYHARIIVKLPDFYNNDTIHPFNHCVRTYPFIIMLREDDAHVRNIDLSEIQRKRCSGFFPNKNVRRHSQPNTGSSNNLNETQIIRVPPKPYFRKEASHGPIGERWRANVNGMSTAEEQLNFLRGQKCGFESSFLLQQIARKWRSYRYQDQIKHIFVPSAFITLDQVVVLLRESNLRCCYCSKMVRLFYDDARAPDQWTLDRINNGYGHNFDNVVIACMHCNLQRRCKRASAFKFAKQMIVIMEKDLIE